ncbi:MAG: hypothetical protein M9924_22115, partial [Rhizobiaceae bacterium]|nr:hypothetical protein [Rhizobiaceae bacterium]
MFDPSPWILKALDTEGGHLFINHGGYCLNYENGTLTGYGPQPVKYRAISAGLPVCDATALDPST